MIIILLHYAGIYDKIKEKPNGWNTFGYMLTEQ